MQPLGRQELAAHDVHRICTMQMRDLPLEACLAVRSTTTLAKVVELAAEAGARYVLVREPTGDVRGVQLTSVASWMAEQSPTSSAEEIPLVDSVQVELGTTVFEALSMMANSRAAVLLVREPRLGTCRIVQKNMVEMSAGVDAAGVGELFS